MKTKTVLITGASSGFGRETSVELARRGLHVFASMRDTAGRNRKQIEELNALRGDQGLPIEVVGLDVTDDSSIASAVSRVLHQSGSLDVVINNAGIAAAGVSEAFSSEQLMALFDVNVIGIQRVLRAVLPAFRRQGHGLVVNVGSVLGRVTLPFFGLYGASKFAVEALTDSYRYELSQFGIDVALIQPSAYPTAMYSSVLQPADPAVAAEYGDVAAIPGAMFQHFMTLFASSDAPDPREVATAIARLIDMPNGSRPARTVVGNSFGADAVNAQTAPVQAGLVKSLGLEHLDRVDERAAA